MKKQVKAAELKSYNANSRGTHTGDCVKRSISLAFSLDYNQAGKILNEKMHELDQLYWNIGSVFWPVIEELGGSKKIVMPKDSPITVNDFVDTVCDKSKNYIILCGKNPGGSTHMVCVRDNIIYDSWDCRDYYVTSYSEIDASSVRPIEERVADDFKDISRKAESVVEAEIVKYASKHDMQIDMTDIEAFSYRYKINVSCMVILAKDDISEKKRKYSFDILIVVQPTIPNDELEGYVLKIAKQRAYDRMWTVNEQEKKLREAREVANQAGLKDIDNRMYYAGPQERKFLNSLPGWVRPLVRYVDIQRPNMYSDSYQLSINKLPSDDMHPDIEHYTFDGYNAQEIKDQLKIYKEEGKLIGIDYYREDRPDLFI